MLRDRDLFHGTGKVIKVISFQKKYLSLVFYDNRNLKISKSKKSEIRLFDEHFARHFESYWRETWRHTGRRTVPQISLETPPPPRIESISLCPQFR